MHSLMKRPAVVTLLATIAASAVAHAAEPSLTAGGWSVVEMAGKRLRTPATIDFTRVRWLDIKTACGPLWGWYRQSGASLKIHIPGQTRYVVGSGSPCRGIDFRLLLGRVRSYEAEADSLVLLNDAGKAVARLARRK